MAASINPIQDIKDRLSVETLIGEYLPLKRAGINLKGICPFHSEKTPSFMVSPERNSWHCFGCSKGGDIFTFVMEMEGLEFREALEYLAKKTGIELPTYKKTEPGVSTQNERLYKINAAAVDFYEKSLNEKSPAAEKARDEIARRKVDELTRSSFHIGFAPAEWDSLTRHLLQKGFKENDLIAAGVVVARPAPKRGVYDRFRNRLMFPLVDIVGRTVGFSARALDPNEKMGKYINSPESAIYHKGRFLFALNHARTEIRKRNFAILVEGQMDAISSHRVGVRNVIATSGTALTEQHLQLIRRYTSNVVLAFDVDIAGASATKRGIDMALASGINVKIAKMPAGVDPDDLCRTDPKAWGAAINQSENIIDYYFRNATAKRDLTRVEHKKAVAREVLPEVARLSDAVEKTHYLQQLAGLLKVDEAVLRQALDKAAANKKRAVARFRAPMGDQATKKIKKVSRDAYRERFARLIALRSHVPDFSMETLAPLKVLEDPLTKKVTELIAENADQKKLLTEIQLLDSTLAAEVNRELFALEKEESDISTKEELDLLVGLVTQEGLRRELQALHQTAAKASGPEALRVRKIFVTKTQELARLSHMAELE
jgi:DNA primase